MNKQALDHSIKFIKSWLQFRYEHEEIPGFVVAIAYKGKLLMNEAYGYADLENKTKLTPRHIFRIASHSKTFTATALMQLQEKNELRIDDYVVKYLPWLNEHPDKRWKKITLRQLMSHGAGVIRDGLDADYWQLERPFPNKLELQNEILEANLVIDTNTKLKYSNYGYSILGMVIEAVSGQTYNKYISKHILEKLRLENTGPEYTSNIKDKLVIGYTRRDLDKTRQHIKQIDTHAMAAATGFYSTSEDLCSYFTAHFVGSNLLIDDESKKEMQRIQWHAKSADQGSHEDYGLGFYIEYLNKRKTIGHGGGFPGHITKSIADPKEGLVVVVLTNCLGGPANIIAKSIYNTIDYYQENTPITKAKHDMARFEGRYMNMWSIIDIVVTGDTVVATFPDTWSPLMFPEKLEYVNDTTLKVIDTSSFDSEGELVHFQFNNKEVEIVKYNGLTMWPEKVWLNRLTQNKTIEKH